jgi:hypothetical protein
MEASSIVARSVTVMRGSVATWDKKREAAIAKRQAQGAA